MLNYVVDALLVTAATELLSVCFLTKDAATVEK